MHLHVIHDVKSEGISNDVPPYTAAVYNLVVVVQVVRSKNGNPYCWEIYRGGIILARDLAKNC